MDQQLSMADKVKAMPNTQRCVKAWRTIMGDQHVTEMQRRALKGERNCFYAMESGHVLGTVFDWNLHGEWYVSRAIAAGALCFVAMRAPDGAVDAVAPMPEARGGTD